MMTAEPDMLVASDEIVRVIGGRLSGREHPVDGQERICIGHALANDIVLRGRGTRDTMLELRRNGHSMALKVLRGRVDLLGRAFEEGEEAALPPYLPFRLGEFVLAYGRASSDRWQDASRAAVSSEIVSKVSLPAPRLSERLYRIGHSHVTGAGRHLAQPRVILAGFSLLALGVAANAIWSNLDARRSSPLAFEDVLQDNGLGGLAVTANPAGGLIVSGGVSSENDMKLLRNLAAGAQAPVMLDVNPPGTLARTATDVLLAQGVDAEAQIDPATPGGVLVGAPYLTADRREELRDLLTRDVPGLRHVAFIIDDSRGDNALQRFFAASGAGLATLVEDPPHIVTADGARWFPGAVLPTGHHLIAIEKNRVRFEKDGRVEELQL